MHKHNSQQPAIIHQICRAHKVLYPNTYLQLYSYILIYTARRVHISGPYRIDHNSWRALYSMCSNTQSMSAYETTVRHVYCIAHYTKVASSSVGRLAGWWLFTADFGGIFRTVERNGCECLLQTAVPDTTVPV